MKKRVQKTITLLDVFEAVKDVKHDIKFLRQDSADMEDHLNNKIKIMGNELKNQIELTESRLSDKIDETKRMAEDLEKIHPKYTHSPLVA